MTKVGLVTRPRTPRPSPMPCVSAVLPAPSGPLRTPGPQRAGPAQRLGPNARVSSTRRASLTRISSTAAWRGPPAAGASARPAARPSAQPPGGRSAARALRRPRAPSLVRRRASTGPRNQRVAESPSVDDQRRGRAGRAGLRPGPAVAGSRPRWHAVAGRPALDGVEHGDGRPREARLGQQGVEQLTAAADEGPTGVVLLGTRSLTDQRAARPAGRGRRRPPWCALPRARGTACRPASRRQRAPVRGAHAVRRCPLVARRTRARSCSVTSSAPLQLHHVTGALDHDELRLRQGRARWSRLCVHRCDDVLAARPARAPPRRAARRARASLSWSTKVPKNSAITSTGIVGDHPLDELDERRRDVLAAEGPPTGREEGQVGAEPAPALEEPPAVRASRGSGTAGPAC